MKYWTELEKNPLTAKEWSQRYRDILVVRTKLPAFRERKRFMKLFRKNNCIVVVGETGSGKTTQLPQFALEVLHEFHKTSSSSSDSSSPIRIACTQPRR